MAHFRYLCIAGTFGRIHDWAHNLNSPFQTALRELGGEPIRQRDGELYTWSGALNGLFWTGQRDWEREADVICELLATVPYEDRIIFAHSHGGQIPIIASSRNGFRFRTLTTIATPYRPNLHPDVAAMRIGFWQHVYDPQKDTTATVPRRPTLRERLGLGGLGGGGKLERRFMIPGIINVGIPGARHSGVFQPPYFEQMVQAGVLHRAFQLGI